MEKQNNTERINKDKIIRVRVTEDEHDKFRKKAIEKGYRSISEYVRTLIEEEADKDDTV